MFNIVLFDQEEQHIDDFLALPKRLYTNKEIMQNVAEEREIVRGTHVLNKYFRQYKILAYSQAEEPCGRCIVTIYPDSDTAYIGYFECVENDECARQIFEKAEECAARENVKKITGPLDSSFWIKYRLKTNGFDSPPYIGEPYNKPYYKRMFEDNGYRAIESWVSNVFTKLPLFFNHDTVYKERLAAAEKKHYRIVNAKPDQFDKTLDIIYELISETFSGFVAFRPIAKEDFREIFKGYRYILDYNLVKIAYDGEQAVAFSIVLPDYQNLLYVKMTLWSRARILLKKLRSRNYVSLYMGVKSEHKGLGKALTQKIIKDMYIRRASCIGALIAKGKITERYMEEQIEDRKEYVLYEKELF
ncbi:MAG: hypothetical protein LBH09_05510 [Peptococcaceae bacterium]|jgi:hypothetical protein|nr:hypothetical protein [Peptococcaceae bacterium]